jgi:hypothetical protein
MEEGWIWEVVWIVKLQGWKGQVKRVFMSGLAY